MQRIKIVSTQIKSALARALGCKAAQISVKKRANTGWDVRGPGLSASIGTPYWGDLPRPTVNIIVSLNVPAGTPHSERFAGFYAFDTEGVVEFLASFAR